MFLWYLGLLEKAIFNPWPLRHPAKQVSHSTFLIELLFGTLSDLLV